MMRRIELEFKLTQTLWRIITPTSAYLANGIGSSDLLHIFVATINDGSAHLRHSQWKVLSCIDPSIWEWSRCTAKYF